MRRSTSLVCIRAAAFSLPVIVIACGSSTGPGFNSEPSGSSSNSGSNVSTSRQSTGTTVVTGTSPYAARPLARRLAAPHSSPPPGARPQARRLVDCAYRLAVAVGDRDHLRHRPPWLRSSHQDSCIPYHSRNLWRCRHPCNPASSRERSGSAVLVLRCCGNFLFRHHIPDLVELLAGHEESSRSCAWWASLDESIKARPRGSIKAKWQYVDEEAWKTTERASNP